MMIIIDANDKNFESIFLDEFIINRHYRNCFSLFPSTECLCRTLFAQKSPKDTKQ